MSKSTKSKNSTTTIKSLILSLVLLTTAPSPTHAFSVSSHSSLPSSNTALYATPREESSPSLSSKSIPNLLRSLALVGAIGFSTTTTPALNTLCIANAYEDSDYASETVQTAISDLKSSIGDVSASFSTFERIAEIITEGKGVGGSLSYTGVQLERGYVADEDTTIYNPGLTLLTESEKERLVDAVIQNRKGNLQQNTWSNDNQYAFDFLKQKLDPLHMVELRGYLGILPFYGAALYVASLAVQQFSRNLFEVAYVVLALAAFLPILVLVLTGS